MTQTLNLIPADAVLEKLTELGKLVAAMADPATTPAPAFLPLGKLSAHFGINRQLGAKLVASAHAAGVLEILRPVLKNGKKCNPLYSVQDFKNYLASHV
jgi:hypothetical protein